MLSQMAFSDNSVTMLERNDRPGRKIVITGKGRCNVTNATVGDEFLKNVVGGKKFVMGAVTRFNS